MQWFCLKRERFCSWKLALSSSVIVLPISGADSVEIYRQKYLSYNEKIYSFRYYNLLVTTQSYMEQIYIYIFIYIYIYILNDTFKRKIFSKTWNTTNAFITWCAANDIFSTCQDFYLWTILRFSSLQHWRHGCNNGYFGRKWECKTELSFLSLRRQPPTTIPLPPTTIPLPPLIPLPLTSPVFWGNMRTRSIPCNFVWKTTLDEEYLIQSYNPEILTGLFMKTTNCKVSWH